jgi:hypothetical protein
MAEPPPVVLPSWVACTPDEVRECDQVAGRVIARGFASQREVSVAATMAWLLIGEVAPLTWRTGERSREVARAESWVALCVAAGQPPPTPSDWSRLGADPLPARVGDREFAYGVWRTLSWLMGVREDWPIYTSWHRAADMPDPDLHLYVPHRKRDTPQWREAARAAWERDEADALRHWRHVRRLADATCIGRSVGDAGGS